MTTKKCLILAGGRGVRLKPLTDTTPKPMLLIKNKPILDYTVSLLPDSVSEVYIVIGWLGDQIKSYFGTYFNGKKINYLEQLEPKGTFNAVNLGREFLKDDSFLVVSGDDLYSKKDILKVSEKESAILAKKTNRPEKFGICKKGEGETLCDIIEKPKDFVGDLANIGVYKLRPTIFEEKIILGQNGEELLAPMIGNLAKKEKINVVEASFWHPIADKDDLLAAQDLELSNI